MFPTEIEADFAHWYPTVDLFWWLRGDRNQDGRLLLSSRRLCSLLAGLKPESEYKTSLRGGYLSQRDLVVYETYNEIAKLRASYYAVKGGEESKYEPFEFIDPVVRIEKLLAQDVIEDETHDASEQLYGDMGL